MNNNYTYETYTEKLIRKKYTISDELSILRQRDTKPEKFLEYFDFCEKCKKHAKMYIAYVNARKKMFNAFQ